MDGYVPNTEELSKNLKHQLSLYRQLVDLLREEREYLVAVKLKEIRECTYSKEALLDEIHREEFRRKRWVKEAAASIQMAEADVTIDVVADRFASGQDRDSLVSLKQALNHLVKKAKDINAENRRLTESALRDATEMKKNILGLSSEQPQVYGPKGNLGNNPRDQSARFFNKEA